MATLGGVLGLGVGKLILSVAPSVIPEGLLPGAVTLTFDARVALFCGAAALLVGILFGLAPAWQSTDFSSAGVIAATGRGTTARGGRMRGALVIGEVATAVLLLFGAGLLLRTLLAVERIDRGYRAESVLSMLVDPLGSKYPTPEALLQFYDAVKQEVGAVPGVANVAWSSGVPLGTLDGGRVEFDIVGNTPVAEDQRPGAEYQMVSDSYFATLDLPIVVGRAFTDRDTSDTVAVCIVNEAFVRSHLQGRSPIGTRISMRSEGATQQKMVVREIVGVARQVKGRPDEAEDLQQIYVPITQDNMDDIYLLVRPKSGRADALTGAVRAAIGRIDREQLVSVRDIVTLDDVARDATSRHRFRAVLVITFATLALVLAMVGVFGILAYSVQQRMRDFAVRRALGATTRDVMRLVLVSAARVVTAGIVLGFVLSILAGRMLTTMLFGVEPLDPLTFVAVTMLLVTTAAVATAAPAWRAMRIDPANALRIQ